MKASESRKSIPESILVIDGDRKTNLQVQDQLRAAGYAVDGVFSGESAFSRITENPEVLLLLDYKLPDLRATELIKALRQRGLAAPFIIMTASHEEKQAARMLKQGAYEYLIKETGFLDLLPALIEKTLHELKMEKQLAELEQALRQSERKYDFVFENASVAMAILAGDGTLLMVNNAFVKLCGYSKKQLEGKSRWQDFVFAEDLKKVEVPHNLSVDHNLSLLNYEFRMTGGRDWVRDIFLTISVIPDNSWRIASFLDVSAMRQIEEALQQSEKQFQSLIKNIPGIVYLRHADRHLTMQYMVQEIEKISGYPASDFINNNVRSYASIIHPDDLALVEAAVEKKIAENKPYEIEYRIIRKNGNIVWVYEKGQKVYSQDTKVWLNGIIFDITERKQIAAALKIALDELRVTFDAIPNAVFLLNRECCIMRYNVAAAKILAKKQADIINKRYYEVIDHLPGLPGKTLYMRMLKSRRRESVVCSLGRKIMEFTIAPIINAEGEIYGSVLVIVDITELKLAELRLEHKTKQLQSIFHTAPIGMGVVSRRVFIQVNDQMCRITGYARNELIGKNARMLYSSEETFRQVGLEYEGTRGTAIAAVKTRFQRKDGRIIDVLLRLSPLNIDINGFTFTVTEIKSLPSGIQPNL
ncbi:MAG: PAS domain S-box protein [Victivallaceae bacterium]|nr:PAS domain S-box protein [Victivallaceae bacterium]